MLIYTDRILKELNKRNIKITGALHIGAHDCEEMPFYEQLSLNKNDILWIDAIEKKVKQAREKHIPNVFHHVITDKDDQDVVFNISNNIQSSSVLPLGTHSEEHPDIVYVDSLIQKSITIDTFFKRANIDPSKYNFWNFDIQGAELMALKGSVGAIKYAKAIYLEVNQEELYVGCGLIDDIDKFLEQYNFKRILTNITIHGWGDALYIKKD